MDTKTFKKIARLLKTVYLEIEQEAIKEGISTLSPEYDQLIALARNKVLESQGFTLQQYREAKAKVAGFSQADVVDVLEQTSNKVQEYNNQHIPTSQEIEQIAEKVAESVAQKYIVPPQITNQIVKETTIEKPITIETTRVTRETYNSKPLEKKLGRILQQLDEIKIPEQINVEQLKKELKSDFSVFFEHNINTLDMPNFRKLAMGLQGQIDDLANRDTLDLSTYLQLSGGTMTGGITNSTSVNPLTTLAESWIGPSSTAGIYFKGGKVGIGTTSPTAVLHLKASTATANTASLKIDAGTVATTAVSGNIESDGTHLYWTDSGGTRRQLDN